MAFLVESPWPILFGSIIVEAVLALALLRTGRGRLLWAMVGVGVFALLGLLAERLIVTDQEAVTNTLETAVTAVENNDIEGLLGCISPTAKQPRNASRWVLERFDVDKAAIRELKIDFNRLKSPPTANAHFQAIGRGTDRKGEIPYHAYGQRVVVHLRLERDRWLVTGYGIEDIVSEQP